MLTIKNYSSREIEIGTIMEHVDSGSVVFYDNNIIVVNGAQTKEQVQAITKILATKYGIELEN